MSNVSLKCCAFYGGVGKSTRREIEKTHAHQLTLILLLLGTDEIKVTNKPIRHLERKKRAIVLFLDCICPETQGVDLPSSDSAEIRASPQ